MSARPWELKRHSQLSDQETFNDRGRRYELPFLRQ